MATPSIAMIPSGYKAEKVYSVLPTNGDGDLTFDRNDSATRVNKSGLIESISTDVPRLDYSDGGCPSLLLEPQAINTQPYSEEFDNGVWSTQRLSITPNDAISPSGLLNADKLFADSGTSSYVFDGISATFEDSYAISVFVKYIDSEEVLINIFGQSGNARFNILNGTVTSNTGTVTEPKIENYGNGWYRCSCKFTATATASVNYGFYLDNVVGKSVHIWGAQVEEGNYATSYIPTTGSPVTRSADYGLKSGLSSYINSSEGVFYVEGKWNYNQTGFRRLIYVINSLGGNYIQVRSTGVLNNIQFLMASGNITTANSSTTDFIVDEYLKVAISYKLNEFKVFINGSQVGSTDTDCLTPTGLDFFEFSDEVSIKDFRVYNTTLSDAELTTLTTI